jgi:hypothetical protein
MSKFDKIFENIIAEANYEQVSDEEYQKVAKTSKLSDDESKVFISLMKDRFKGSFYSPGYAKEWSDRIKKGTAWIYADGSTRTALDKLGYKLSKEEEAIKKSQEEQK